MREGKRLLQEALARSLGLIAEQGAEAMYDGELGEAIDSAVQENADYLTPSTTRETTAPGGAPRSASTTRATR